MKTKFIIIYFLFMFSNYLHAIEIEGELSVNNKYENYYYSMYKIEISNKNFSIEVKDQDFDSYLIIKSPTGEYASNDDYGKSNSGNSGNSGIDILEGAKGQWLIVVTSYKKKKSGRFTLSISEGKSLNKLNESKQDFLEKSFLERGVKNTKKERKIKVNLLKDQLTLKSYRDQLIKGLKSNIDPENTIQDLEDKLNTLKLRKLELNSVKQDITTLDSSSKDFLLPIIVEKIDNNSEIIKLTSSSLEIKVLENEAFKIAIMKIKSIGKYFDELSNLELLLSKSEKADKMEKEIFRQRERLNKLLESVAEKLFDSSFSQSLNLGVIDLNKENIRVHTTAKMGGIMRSIESFNRNSVVLRSSVQEMRAERREISNVDPNVWFPELFPWPPPQASARVVVDDLYGWKGRFNTLGDVDSLLNSSLVSVGYGTGSYFGVPSGFALVTPLEQVDGTAVSLQSTSRWSTNIQSMKNFSIAEYLRALLTAEPGYYRVITFIVSSQPFSTNGDIMKFATIQKWANSGVTYLPNKIQKIKYSKDYRTTVLIYEFLKKNNNDEVKTSIPGMHSAQTHLNKSKLSVYIK